MSDFIVDLTPDPLPYCSTFWLSHGCDKPYGHAPADPIHECLTGHGEDFPPSRARVVPPGVNHFNEYGDRIVSGETSDGFEPGAWRGCVLYTNHQDRVIQ